MRRRCSPFDPSGSAMSIPGWSQVVADVFSPNRRGYERVPTAAHLASWAGGPGCDERRAGSIGGHPSRQPASQAALGVAALSAARTKDTYYGARYRRIRHPRCPPKQPMSPYPLHTQPPPHTTTPTIPPPHTPHHPTNQPHTTLHNTLTTTKPNTTSSHHPPWVTNFRNAKTPHASACQGLLLGVPPACGGLLT